MISPIQLVLGWFGYTKIPKAAVLLSMRQECFFEALLKQEPEGKDIIQSFLKGQITLTQFLRTGRLLQ